MQAAPPEDPEPARVPATAPWGFLQGKMRLKEDFDAPLPDEMMLAFGGREDATGATRGNID